MLVRFRTSLHRSPALSLFSCDLTPYSGAGAHGFARARGKPYDNLCSQCTEDGSTLEKAKNEAASPLVRAQSEATSLLGRAQGKEPSPLELAQSEETSLLGRVQSEESSSIERTQAGVAVTG